MEQQAGRVNQKGVIQRVPHPNLTFVIQRVPFKHIRLFLLDRHVCICFNFVIFFEVSLPLLGEGFAEHAFSLLQHPVLCGVCVCACAWV